MGKTGKIYDKSKKITPNIAYKILKINIKKLCLTHLYLLNIIDDFIYISFSL